jgi:hypothetical protein
MILLQQKMNASLKSGGFSKKKSILSASKFRLTAEVGRRRQWTSTSIDERQRQLAKLAVKTWPLK